MPASRVQIASGICQVRRSAKKSEVSAATAYIGRMDAQMRNGSHLDKDIYEGHKQHKANIGERNPHKRFLANCVDLRSKQISEASRYDKLSREVGSWHPVMPDKWMYHDEDD